MKFENTEVWGFEHALRGMRNPMNSWDKSDSEWVHLDSCYINKNGETEDTSCNVYKIGKNDLELAQRLIKAGSEHRKFLRQIFVSVDVTAPSYFMAELDTYKVGVTRMSTSIQHKGISHRYTIDDFEVDDDIKEVKQAQVSVICRDEKSTSENKELFEHCWYWEQIIDTLNALRDKYLDTKDYKYFRLIRQLMPMGYLYKSTITMSYENVLNVYNQRCAHPHKLTEWSVSFKKWVESLPYARRFFIEPFEKAGDKND